MLSPTDGLRDHQTIDDLWKGQIMAYVQVAISVALVYDHLTTFDLEVELIWKKKMSLVKVLFLVARYLGDFVPISACAFLFTRLSSEVMYVKIFAGRRSLTFPIHEGHPSGIIQASAGFFVVFATQAIMQYRVSAMYQHSKIIIVILLSGFAIEIVASITVAVLGFSAMASVEISINSLHLCFSPDIPMWYFVLWIPMIIFEAFLLGITLWAAVKHTHETKAIALTVERPPSLSYILMRDSILFPMIAVTIYIINTLAWRFFHPFLQQISLSVAEVGSCVLGCRLIINLRKAYYQPFRSELEQSRSVRMLSFVRPEEGEEQE